MRKIKEVLRLTFENHLSARRIAKSCEVAKSTVQEYLSRAQKAALTWPLPPRKTPVARNGRYPPGEEKESVCTRGQIFILDIRKENRSI